MLKRNCRVFHFCFVFTVLMILISGCKGNTPLPQQADIPDRFIDQLPLGTSSLSGKIVIDAPEIFINSDSLEPSLEFNWDLGLLVAGESKIGRSLGNISVRRGSSNDNAKWVVPFSFENIPPGEYELRFFRIREMDWNLYSNDTYWTSEPIIVSEDELTKRVGNLHLGMFGSEGIGSIKGKVLLSGFAVPKTRFRISETGEFDNINAFNWIVPFRQNDNGRLNYEIKGLPPNGYRLSGRFINGNEIDLSNTQGVIEESNITLSANIIGNSNATGRDGADIIHTFGQMNIKYNVNRIDWIGDLVVVVERVGGAQNTHQLHRSFITIYPQDETADGTLRLSGLDNTCDYTVKALLLGEGLGEAELVGEFPGVVELIKPESTPPSNPYPRADVSLDIELD